MTNTQHRDTLLPFEYLELWSELEKMVEWVTLRSDQDKAFPRAKKKARCPQQPCIAVASAAPVAKIYCCREHNRQCL